MTLRLPALLVTATIGCLVGFSLPASVLGQAGRPHYLQRADAPPGNVGHAQVTRWPALQGYVQPVEVHVPDETVVSVADNGQFGPAFAGSIKVGLLVGKVYRFRVSTTLGSQEVEVFPSVELMIACIRRRDRGCVFRSPLRSRARRSSWHPAAPSWFASFI